MIVIGGNAPNRMLAAVRMAAHSLRPRVSQTSTRLNKHK